jgi:hypothetical protein
MLARAELGLRLTGPAAIVDMQPIPSKQKPQEAGPDPESLKARALLMLTQKPEGGSGLARRMHMNKGLVLQTCADMEADRSIELVGKRWTAVVPAVPVVPTQPIEPRVGNASNGSPLYWEPGTGTDPEPMGQQQ